ncbi:MAG: DUF2272 domain-containing protein [Xanthomonadaceae bacterium]|nr:DUF2272 domain-containing protein [Xanthomonadaceae bacterium]
MMPKAWMHALLMLGLLSGCGVAGAADQCPTLSQRQTDAQVATRVAAVACEEYLRWNRPFIDDAGRLANLPAYEAEDTGLKDGGAPWRRVAFYWQASGLLPAMAYKSGASDCSMAAMSLSYPGLGCRGFIIDNPWSAAFISWVMERAGVPGFHDSPSHFDYVRAARKDAASPYRFVAPASSAVQTGDLLCFNRSRRIQGYDGLVRLIDQGGSGLPMHCDIIVAIDAGKVYAIGGNVQQAVTLRRLPVDAQGRLTELAYRSQDDAPCTLDDETACNFNRQDWVVLLQLKSQDELARIGPVAPPGFQRNPPVPEACCVNCVLGSGVPRCPAPGQPALGKPDDPLPGGS